MEGKKGGKLMALLGLLVMGLTLLSACSSSAPTPTPQAAAPSGRNDKEVANLNKMRPSLVATLDALKAGDVAKARDAFDHNNPNDYNTIWHGMEVYINFRAPAVYHDLEVVHQDQLTKLMDDPTAKVSDMVAEAQIMLTELDGLIVAAQNGQPLSPLFEDLADTRLLLAQTLTIINNVLKTGDVATAKSRYTEFTAKWPGVKSLIQGRSAGTVTEIEAAMAKVNAAFQKSTPDAAELTPLVATLVERYGYARNLINAAARNADVTKTTYTSADVQAAAVLAAIVKELNAAQSSWQAGNYADSATRTGNAAGALFDKVSAVLHTHNNADAALKTALNNYAALADKAGDATAVSGVQKKAVEATWVAQQVVAGQFWTDPKLQDAISQAVLTIK